MPFDELPDFIVYLFDQTTNDQIWEAWKSNPFREVSFEQYKESVLHEATEKAKPKEQIETEANRAKNNALNQLKNYSGGDQFDR